MSKILTTFVSDTHTLHKRLNLPGGDLLCLTGDFMSSGYVVQELNDFVNWLVEKGSPIYKHIVVVAGNHDRICETFPDYQIKDMFEKTDNIHYLKDETIELDFEDKGKLTIVGTPYQPDFCSWAFNVKDPDKLQFIYENVIGENIDILLTHCPPFSILDQTHMARPHFGKDGTEHLGSIELLNVLKNLENPPRYHCFGHIHGDGGKHVKIDNTTYINASFCNEQYKPVNQIITLEIDGRKE